MQAGIVPFTIFECDFALYEASAAAPMQPMGEVFLGGSAEKAQISGSFAEVQFQYQGAALEETRHTGKRHQIELVNPLAVQKRPDLETRIGNPGDEAFNRQYLLVLRWHDRQKRAWMKRCYFGVTVQPARIDAASEGSKGPGGPVMHQSLTLRANAMAQQAGSGAQPDMGVMQTGEIRYISGTESMVLYTYSGNADSGAFAPVEPSLLTGRAEIAEDADSVEITIGGTLALRASQSGGVEVKSLLDAQTYSDAVPRLEFWLGGVRRGTLTQAGLLVAQGFTDTPEEPSDTTALRFEDAGGNWLFSLGALITARSFADTL